MVLGKSGKVAVADLENNRVQVFDRDGSYLSHFGTQIGQEDGQLDGLSGIASDAQGNIIVADVSTNRLQVFDTEGRHLCTRHDLGLKANSGKSIAWGKDGQLALANGQAREVRAWW